MHQQEVAGVVLLAHHLGYAGRHRHGGHAGGTDEGIDLLLEEQVHELGKQDAAGGAEAEGHHAHGHDLDGLEGQEGGAGGRCADADAKEDGDDIDELVLHGLAEPLCDAALLKEVAQHEAGNEGGGRGHQQQRLKLLYDAQIQQHAGDAQHDEATPVAVLGKEVEAGVL